MIARISAVICTYNRCADLAHALNGLINQTIAAKEYEILVVDNNSTDSTREVVDSFRRSFDNLHYILEPKQGLAAARNAALKYTSCEFVAFTDDDAIPYQNWLELILNRFDTLPKDTVAVGGDIEPLWEVAPPKWLSNRLLHSLSAGLKWSARSRYLRHHEWLIEVNICFRRLPLLSFGGFPEELGRVGLNLLSGENAVNLLLSAAGHLFYYDPDILVKHKIAASRLSKQWFRRRFFWQGVTNYYVKQYVLKFVAEQQGHDNELQALRRIFNWYSTKVPSSPSQWSKLFDDADDMDFEDTLSTIEGVGYLFASQGILLGR